MRRPAYNFRQISIVMIVMLLICAFSNFAWAERETKSGFEHDPGFGGPTEASALMAEDDEVKDPAFRFSTFDRTLKPWFDWKGKLNKDHGVQLGVSYTSLYQGASSAPTGTDDKAASGIFRLTAIWTLFKTESGDSGALSVGYDHRHAYIDTAPGKFGFAGNYGISGTLFNDVGGILGNLNYQQTFNSNSTGLIVGRYDPNDYFDVLGSANPWTGFQNLYILFNGSIALPDWSAGIGGGHWLNEQWYVKAAANDVNGVQTSTAFKFDLNELYTTAEIGWSPSRAQRYLKNVHLMYWHADAKENNGSEESEGVVIGANWFWADSWMLFTKAGWSKGSAPLFNEAYTLGMLHHFKYRSDLVGFAINWGEPPKNSGLNEQWTSELFYRLQFAQNLALTPSLQYIVNPALNPTEDSLFIFGLRLRLTL